VWATDRFLLALLTALPWTASLHASPASPSALPGPPPAAQAPRIESLPQPAARHAIDLEALARGFASEGSNAALPATGQTQLLVFISLAMPEATLKRLIDQAARAPARLVLRGLSEGSLVRTATRVQALTGQRQVAIQIDPREFDRYTVRRVPAFVLVRDEAAGGCAVGQCAGAAHASVAGDVSLDHALEQIRDRVPGLREEATRLLASLRR
jgi:conjugal transfer pilus assembly protein TrbC